MKHPTWKLVAAAAAAAAGTGLGVVEASGIFPELSFFRTLIGMALGMGSPVG